MKQIIRAGGYAVSTIGARPWITTPVEHKKEKQSRLYKQSIVVNPIFKECASITDDSMWQTIFNQAAVGKFPKGFMYKDGKLTSRGKSKVRTIEISEDPIETLTMCIEFFKITGGLISESDQQRNKLEYENIKENGKEVLSNDIKYRKIKRDEYIKSYLENLGKEYNLNKDEMNDLYCLVEIGFFLNRFEYKDINLGEEKDCIYGIDGLVYDNNVKRFVISEKNTIKFTPRPTKKKVVKEGAIDLKWRKFLEDLEKKKRKTNFQSMLLTSPNVHHSVNSENDT